MGDIDEQTLAGAISTGTHGTGGVAAGLAAQVAGLELVTGTGELLRATPRRTPTSSTLARVGLGALGILTTITFRVEPLFLLEAHEEPMSWDEALGGFDEMAGAQPPRRHVLVPPHRPDAHQAQRPPRRRPRRAPSRCPRCGPGWTTSSSPTPVFGALTARRQPRARPVPRINRVAAPAAVASARYSDVAHRVFTSPRGVRLPRDGVRRARARPGSTRCASAAGRWRPRDLADHVPGRDPGRARRRHPAVHRARARPFYLAFHTHRDADHRAYFALMEPILRAHDGRPHWGKVHTWTAADLAPAYPRFGEFLALRDRLDPDRVFANDHLGRVLGD